MILLPLSTFDFRKMSTFDFRRTEFIRHVDKNVSSRYNTINRK